MNTTQEINLAKQAEVTSYMMVKKKDGRIFYFATKNGESYQITEEEYREAHNG